MDIAIQPQTSKKQRFSEMTANTLWLGNKFKVYKYITCWPHTFVRSRSDDCNFFIWERPTNMIKSIYKGDMAIVNCVQPHPTTCLLATSGIDHEIKIWSPLARVRMIPWKLYTFHDFTIIFFAKQINEERSNRVQYIEGTIDLNQKKMKSDPFDINAPSTYCRSS